MIIIHHVVTLPRIVGTAFNRVYQPLLKEPGLTHPQFITMIMLWEQEVVRRVREATGLQDKQVRQLTKEVNALRKALEEQSSRRDK